MKQTLLIILFFFLLLAVVTNAQVEEVNSEPAILNSDYFQHQPQSIFDDPQPIANSAWEWIHPTPQGNNLRWLKVWDANNWYAIGYAGTFIKTTDGGSNWTMSKNITGLTSTASTQDLFGGYFLDLNTGLACGEGGKVARTTDAGDSWTDVSPAGIYYRAYI